MKVYEKIESLVFPENIYCVSCGDMLPAGHPYGLCESCISKISWKAGPIEKAEGERHDFDCAFTVCVYNGFSKDIIYKLKFGGEPYIAKNMARLMAETLAANVPALHSRYIVCPVPMHKAKESTRGYNQAALLAEGIAERLGLMYAKALVKIKPTASMRTARRPERLSLLDGSMALAKGINVKGRDMILVDDVFTTGATADACSRVLKEGGALSVSFISFAAVGEKEL